MRDMRAFWAAQAEWSEATFGPSSVRGPRGPLRHLLKEIEVELLGPDGNLHDLEEYVDCQFLLYDAARRAGFTYQDMEDSAWAKLEKNKARQWGDTSDPDAPVEHIRG